MMMVFGVAGYFLRKAKFPPAPLVLAMILGRILERSFLQSLQVSAADLSIFIQEPISATLLLVTAFVMLTPAARWLWRQRHPTPTPA
jgi:putative tricarboxylic transport membrane protein